MAVQTVALALELLSRYLSFAVLFISLWKKSKPGHVLQGKGRRLDNEDNAPTPTADAADESNVKDRSLYHYQYFAFLFGIASSQFADQHLKY